MSRLTNNSSLSLFAQVFLATDYYDKEAAGLSVTTLLKPIKQVILARRVPESERVADVSDFIPTAVGSAIHDGFERAWKSPKLDEVLQRIGIPKRVAHKVRVNPSADDVTNLDIIPVYTEIRVAKMVQGVKVTGAFDFIGDGVVEDLKNTSTYKYMSGDQWAYIMQGSLYRWLNPEKVTKDHMNLTFNFTDWSRASFRQNPDRYPPQRMMTVRMNLVSIEEADAYVQNRVSDLIRLADATEEEMPPCSDKDLWRKPDQFKFYAKAENAGVPGSRSTKNFNSHSEALNYQASKGGGGAVVIVRGDVGACKFCPAFLACKQKDQLIASGDLVL